MFVDNSITKKGTCFDEDETFGQQFEKKYEFSHCELFKLSV